MSVIALSTAYNKKQLNHRQLVSKMEQSKKRNDENILSLK